MESQCGGKVLKMKSKIIIGSIVGVAVIAAIAVAAEARAGQGWRGHRWGHFGPAGYLVHELKLTDEQSAQIRTMWQAEKPAVAKLVREVSAEAKEMDAATRQGNVDANRVEEIAARQGASIAKLLMEKERVKSQIYASVLSSEQRTKADELQRVWHARLDRIADQLEK
jgi:Spy/CpxP family protein refolding chaperone